MNNTTTVDHWNRFLVKTTENTFIFQVILGISGNVLNLSVLLSRGMRRKSNTLLALAAFSDIILLILLIPNNLSRRSAWMFEECDDPMIGDTRKCRTTFHNFFRDWKPHLTFGANCFSASGTWFLVAVSFDRLWAIKSPLQSTSTMFIMRTSVLATVIFGFNAIASMHYLIPIPTPSINSTVMSLPPWVRIQSIFIIMNTITQFIIPLCLLITLNLFIVYYLRNRRFLFEPRDGQRTGDDELPPLLDVATPNAPFPAPRNWSRKMARTERHITITVVAIISFYVITQLPITIVYSEMYLIHSEKRYAKSSMYTNVALTYWIMIWGKVANFFLFCLSSQHFRRQLWKQIARFIFHRTVSIRDSNHLPPTRSIPLNTLDNTSNRPSP